MKQKICLIVTLIISIFGKTGCYILKNKEIFSIAIFAGWFVKTFI